MKNTIFKWLPLSLFMLSPVHAAISVDLMQQSTATLPALFAKAVNAQFTETNRSLDVNKTLHVRIKQQYLGYPVWNADAIVHIRNAMRVGKSFNDVITAARRNPSFMNGTLYQNLHADLMNTPAMVFEPSQAQKALEHVMTVYQQQRAKSIIRKPNNKLIVYVDKDHKAHWAYKISFFASPIKSGTTPSQPVYIVDAIDLHTYITWNDLKTSDAEVDGGGFGGNKKKGKLIYDGLNEHLAKLTVIRQNAQKTCLLQNSDVNVKDEKTNEVIKYKCNYKDAKHNHVYWDGQLGAVNGGYSPGNDALFAGYVLKHMYQDWYSLPVLKNSDGSPMILNMVVHADMDNAYWSDGVMVFGDGVNLFHPLTSIGVAAHEISHGFTEQHSHLAYYGQSGGINESYSDMATQAAEVYAYGAGANNWQIGSEILKNDEAMRYMDQPSKDCKDNQKPGYGCSIDDASQYDDDIDVHYTSGVYNRLFYLIGNSPGWDVRKAFDVMVDANRYYWTEESTYETAACGVLQATQDRGFDLQSVKSALEIVKVDYSHCKTVVN